MLRAGAMILTLWSAFNLVLALGILIMILGLGKNAPALVILFGNIQAAGMDPRALATVNALAVIFNGCAAAFCSLSLVVIWQALVHGAKWAFWSLGATLLFLQASGFASDELLGNRDLLANAVSSVLLLLGLALAAYSLFRKEYRDVG
jgi:hypothetical protein